MARGFIPVGLRSSPKKAESNQPDTPRPRVLGLLRSPAGMNPLATGFNLSPLQTGPFNSSCYDSMRLIPVIAHAHFHQQRHVQRGGGAHVLADFLAHLVDQVFTHFQHQFVVYLQDDFGIQP
ncbi:hypothetical protein SAMN03159382_01900 [Pseudomonas sp. NFACC23-1]|nr:hypothetical protein SAMN03159386_01656 [Pseudomonas sp. NFACC17-2]SEJ29984.1 hypothetical protein SAMN03159382_01900 [Pseudomonas sp. NFACC23-1]SFW64810.1 hypothetical protein SAMN05660640_02492 [Pseudomonas sp. NFACC16-2]